MRVPFRSLHLVPAHLCVSPACMSSVLDGPVVARVPVQDSIGVEYAFDVQVTQGFYTLLVAFVALRWLRARLLEALDERGGT